MRNLFLRNEIMNIQVPFILLGLGPVGRTLVRQILDTHKTVAQRTGIQFILAGISDSSGVDVGK